MTAPGERPILFSGSMVRAILREIEKPGTGKTQTRRAVSSRLFTRADISRATSAQVVADRTGRSQFRFDFPAGVMPVAVPVPYSVGDRLYARETWSTSKIYDGTAPRDLRDGSFIRYEADGSEDKRTGVGRNGLHTFGKLRPGMHMPRWASRITLEVTGVRVERVQDISEADAIAEGCPGTLGPNPDFPDEYDPSPAEEFRDLWTGLNGALSWKLNPWVAVYTFRPMLGNIDTIKEGKCSANKSI